MHCMSGRFFRCQTGKEVSLECLQLKCLQLLDYCFTVVAWVLSKDFHLKHCFLRKYLLRIQKPWSAASHWMKAEWAAAYILGVKSPQTSIFNLIPWGNRQTSEHFQQHKKPAQSVRGLVHAQRLKRNQVAPSFGVTLPKYAGRFYERRCGWIMVLRWMNCFAIKKLDRSKIWPNMCNDSSYENYLGCFENISFEIRDFSNRKNIMKIRSLKIKILEII